MAIDEASRHQLHRDLERSLGPASATALMELLPPVGWADVATKRDLDMVRIEFKGELDALEGRLRQEIGALDGKIGALDGKVDALGGAVDGKIDALAAKLGGFEAKTEGRMAGLEAKIDGMPRRLWAANVATMIGVAALVLAAVRFA